MRPSAPNNPTYKATAIAMSIVTTSTPVNTSIVHTRIHLPHRSFVERLYRSTIVYANREVRSDQREPLFLTI
jgi:hypothetical protein